MDLVKILIVAVGLAMDAFAVSIVSGGAYKQLKIRHAFRIAVFFGGFQAFMPLLGSLVGFGLKRYIQNYDHWLAFILLSAVGGKMIYESFKIGPNKSKLDTADNFVLLILAIATSVDALVVGITLSMIANSIIKAAAIIGLVTFVLSYAGVFIGRKFGHFFENKIEAVGGLLLIGLGMKLLIEHIYC
jgi:manganese efflux pump family protein